MAGHHVSEKVKGGEGLSAHLAVKPDLFLGILRTLLDVSVVVTDCCRFYLPFFFCVPARALLGLDVVWYDGGHDSEGMSFFFFFVMSLDLVAVVGVVFSKVSCNPSTIP